MYFFLSSRQQNVSWFCVSKQNVLNYFYSSYIHNFTLLAARFVDLFYEYFTPICPHALKTRGKIYVSFVVSWGIPVVYKRLVKTSTQRHVLKQWPTVLTAKLSTERSIRKLFHSSIHNHQQAADVKIYVSGISESVLLFQKSSYLRFKSLFDDEGRCFVLFCGRSCVNTEKVWLLPITTEQK